MVDNKMPTHVQFFLFNFCIKEPLDFIRVPQIELFRFSKFPGVDPIPPNGRGQPPPIPTPTSALPMTEVRAFFSQLNFQDNRQTNFLATTLHIFNYHI